MLPERFGNDIYDPEFHQYWAEAKEFDVESDLEGYYPKPQLDYSILTPEEKNSLRVSDSAPFCIYRDIIKTIRRDACVRCWLLKRACMCNLIKPAFLPSNIHFHFIVHYSEFSRTSNTVKIFKRSIQNAAKSEYNNQTGTCEMLFFGIESHEDRLITLLREKSANTLVLFPSSNPPAISVDEFLKTRRKSSSLTSQSSSLENIERIGEIHVIVIDGTWKQANHIHKRLIDDSCTKFNLPLPTYVKIDPGSILENNKSLFEPLRSQTQSDRCCTLEASVALLKELGCTMDETGEPLLHNLKALVDSQLSQSAIQPIYGIVNEARHKEIALSQHTFPKGSRVGKVDDESLRYVAMTGCLRKNSKDTSYPNNGHVKTRGSKQMQWTTSGKRVLESTSDAHIPIKKSKSSNDEADIHLSSKFHT